MKKIIIASFLIVGLVSILFCNTHNQPSTPEPAVPLYFCTAADEKHFPLLINLIGSIERFHYDELGEIAVFDLGLTQEQIEILLTIKKVTVNTVELTNPQLLTPLEVHRGKTARGLYSWKPVVIKQSLDKFPYMLYLDAGALILRPVTDLFRHIQEHGYFLIDCGHNIAWMTTKYVLKKFDLEAQNKLGILYQNGLSAGFQGLTRAMYKDYVLPMYELSKDIRAFVDDGTTPNGFGAGRHDQPLFSIQARLLGLHINIVDHSQRTPVYLSCENKKIPLYITYLPEHVSEKTHIYQCRFNRAPDFRRYIRYT